MQKSENSQLTANKYTLEQADILLNTWITNNKSLFKKGLDTIKDTKVFFNIAYVASVEEFTEIDKIQEEIKIPLINNELQEASFEKFKSISDYFKIYDAKKQVEFPLLGSFNSRTCEKCHGEGLVTCPTCQGIGKMKCEKCKGETFIKTNEEIIDKSNIHNCPACHGTGGPNCPLCRGFNKQAIPCSVCSGAGCQACRGVGYQLFPFNNPPERKVHEKITKCDLCDKGEYTCKTCKGERGITCPDCQGKGEYLIYDKLKYKFKQKQSFKFLGAPEGVLQGLLSKCHDYEVVNKDNIIKEPFKGEEIKKFLSGLEDGFDDIGKYHKKNIEIRKIDFCIVKFIYDNQPCFFYIVDEEFNIGKFPKSKLNIFLTKVLNKFSFAITLMTVLKNRFF